MNYRISVDIGGRFADRVVDDAVNRTVAKALTTPEEPTEAVQA